MRAALARDKEDWQLCHACPACMYKLHDELILIFEMLYAMDGNDSLKRILRRLAGVEGSDVPGPSRERIDEQMNRSSLYISQDYVNKWAKTIVAEVQTLAEDVGLYNIS